MRHRAEDGASAVEYGLMIVGTAAVLIFLGHLLSAVLIASSVPPCSLTDRGAICWSNH